MKKRNVGVLIFLLVVGFAAVATTLEINGNINLLGDADIFDGDVVFTKAKTDKGGTASITESGKKIEFSSKELTMVSDTATLNFAIANKNRNYDAVANINCNAAASAYADYISVLPNQTEYEVAAGATVNGNITVGLIKAVESSQEINLICELNVSAKERESLGDEYVDEPFSKAGILKMTTYDNDSDFWKHKSKITKVVFEDKMVNHGTSEDGVLEFDVSDDTSESSVMSYLVPNISDASTYTLYIQSETGVKANPDSSNLFRRFSNLVEVDGLQYFDTSNVKNILGMFWDCSSLKELNLSVLNLSQVTDMRDLVRDCTSLTSLDLSNVEAGEVLNMGYMFFGCSSLVDLKLDNFIVNQVTEMQEMFSSCISLKNLNLSGFDTSNVTTMSYMFGGCNALTSLELGSNFKTGKVTNMSRMFCACSSLTSLDLSGFDTSNVTDMSNMFADCKQLVTLNLESFETSNVTDIEYMFVRCGNLINLNISNFDFSKLTSHIDYSSVFKDMPDGANLTVKDETAQGWILRLASTDRPIAWTVDNVVVKS